MPPPDSGGGSAASRDRLPDADLMAHMARRDDAALAEFYDRHGGTLYSFALRILTDSAAAEQVVLEAMTTIWEQAARYSISDGTALSWALAITRQAAVARLRLRPALVETAPRSAPPTHSTGARPSGLQTALARLERGQRELLELTFFGGMNLHELAIRIGIPLNEARTRLRHAMMTLRDTVEGRL